jgi:hypothetical protein
MKIKIHLGAHEIEGTYIQLSNENTSLLTDLVTKDRITGKY